MIVNKAIDLPLVPTSDDNTRSEVVVAQTLVSLPPDALVAILARTSSADHNNLRSSCRTLRDAVDSPSFLAERVLSGWVEVSTTFLSGKELYARDNPSEYADPDHNDDEIISENYGDFYSIEEYGINRMHGKIWVDGKLGGSASVTLVPRDSWGSWNFHTACNSVSREVETSGMQIFDRVGRVRASLGSVKASDEGPDGYFAHIDTFCLEPKYRGWTDIAANAIRSLLCSTQLWERWSLAVYIPDARAHYTDDDTKYEKLLHSRSAEHGGESNDLAELQLRTGNSPQQQVERFQMLARWDMRYFLRAGFRQVTELVAFSRCYHVFAVPSFLTGSMMSHQTALAIPIAERPSLPAVPTGVNAELLRLFLHLSGKEPDADIRVEVVRLVGAGATVEGSHALHCCASNLETGLIELLLEFTPSPRDAIDGLDRNGLTPLMCAAGSNDDVKDIYAVCDRLIGKLGANRSIVDHSGKTALGHFREHIQKKSDYNNTLGLNNDPDQEELRVRSELERLLMPQGGATAADEAIWEEEVDGEFDNMFGEEEDGDESDLDMDDFGHE